MEIYEDINAEELKETVCKIFDEMNIKYKTEWYSSLGSSIIGKRRRVDVVVLGDNDDEVMFIECKYQNVAGTAEDKLFRAVVEANRDKQLGIPSIIVFGGFGWSPQDMRHALLNGSVRIELFRDWARLYFNYVKLKPNSIASAA